MIRAIRTSPSALLLKPYVYRQTRPTAGKCGQPDSASMERDKRYIITTISNSQARGCWRNGASFLRRLANQTKPVLQQLVIEVSDIVFMFIQPKGSIYTGYCTDRNSIKVGVKLYHEQFTTTNE